MELKTWFEREIVPCVRADGGWLELSDGAGDAREVTARGECAHCAALEACLRWAEKRVQEELKRDIRFTAVRSPFLWRK